MLKKIRPLVIVNFVVFYVFASYGWWSILLVSKNDETFKSKAKVLQLMISPNSNQYLDSEEYNKLEEHYKAEKLMIIGEGSVYMLLLALGAIQIRQSFKKEMDLNRLQKNFLLSITHELKSPL